MSISVKTLLIKLLMWLAAEVILNLVGLDNLADYSEFMLNKMTRVCMVAKSPTF